MIFIQVSIRLVNSLIHSHTYYLDAVVCVKWSPNGTMIATTSDDSKAKLLDFKAGKVLFTGSSRGNVNCLILLSNISLNYQTVPPQFVSSKFVKISQGTPLQ